MERFVSGALCILNSLRWKWFASRSHRRRRARILLWRAHSERERIVAHYSNTIYLIPADHLKILSALCPLSLSLQLRFGMNEANSHSNLFAFTRTK